MSNLLNVGDGTRGKNRDRKIWLGRNGTVRERETMLFFVPDPSRRWFLFPPCTIPPYVFLFPSYCLPSSRLFPVQLAAQLFTSHPDVPIVVAC